MITAATPHLINTHDDAKDFIRSCAPGCKVEFIPVRNTQKTMRFVLTVERLGKQTLSIGDAYSLPFVAFVMKDYLKKTLEDNFGR